MSDESNLIGFPRNEENLEAQPPAEEQLPPETHHEQPTAEPAPPQEIPVWVTELEEAFGKDNLERMAAYFGINELGTHVNELYQRNNITLGMLQELGKQLGFKLKSRQLPANPEGKSGVQFYWERAGRIILPSGPLPGGKN